MSPPIAGLLPHAAPMVLLDDLAAWDEVSATARVTIRADHPFATPDGVPAHVGIEMMAQACGAHTGALARRDGLPVRVGFLLGTRGYTAAEDWFRPGDRLEVSARVAYRDDGMGVYDCRIARDGAMVAEAQLTVYQPEDEYHG